MTHDDLIAFELMSHGLQAIEIGKRAAEIKDLPEPRLYAPGEVEELAAAVSEEAASRVKSKADILIEEPELETLTYEERLRKCVRLPGDPDYDNWRNDHTT